MKAEPHSVIFRNGYVYDDVYGLKVLYYLRTARYR